MKTLIPALVALVTALSPAAAQAPRVADIVQAEVRPGWRTAQGTRMAAVQLQLADGWITYWRHPGETGIPPRLDLSGSTNLREAALHWPEPRLFYKAGFASIGYAGRVVLPVEIGPARPGAPVALRARLSIGVCADICIPVDLTLSARLDGAGARDGAIAAALDSRPSPAHTAGLSAVACRLRPAGDGLRLTARWSLPRQSGDEFLLMELPGDAGWRVRSLPSERDGATLVGHAKLTPTGQGAGAAIDRGSLRMTLVTPQGALTHRGCAG